MFKLLILLPVAALWTGCVSASGPTDEPTAAEVRNAWFEALDRTNPDLHDMLLVALHLSRHSGSTVFVRRLAIDGNPWVEGAGADEAPRHYRATTERGGADNVVGVNFATREFLFDHYLPADGPTLQEIRTRLRDAARIRRIKRDLGIFGEE